MLVLSFFFYSTDKNFTLYLIFDFYPSTASLVMLLFFSLHFKGVFTMDEYLHSFREMISLRGLTDHTLTSYCTYIRTYLPIKSGSVLHQGSSRYSTPGTRSCPTMYTCTASSPAAGLPRTEKSADYGAAFLSPSGSSGINSGENIWHVFHHSMKAAPWYFPLPAKACVILIPGKDFWTAFIKKNGALH